MIEFQPFPKLARLSRECIITEKLDGTNAQIIITKSDGTKTPQHKAYDTVRTNDGEFFIGAGSRTRLITPGKTTDNFGFAGWVWENAEQLVQLGPGRHYGEWWGKGIQRGYGLAERRFSLFHTHGIAALPECVSVVPKLYTGVFSTGAANMVLHDLSTSGSVAAPGFMNPEGIVVFHEHAGVAFKKTFDDRHKESIAA